MKFVDEYRDAGAARQYADAIARLVTRPWTVMEVCGGQTHAIVKFGIDQLLPQTVDLVHGPGCPVCVTPVGMIDKAIEIALRPDVIFTSFGDTKVVDRGSGDGIFINTSGIGSIEGNAAITPGAVRRGDVMILSGDIGRHGMAVMAAREGLELERPIERDTAALCAPVMALFAAGIEIHCLRDPTRGGLATSLVEIAEVAGVTVNIDEATVPVSDEVRGASCEILGFDPLYVANEGRFIAFVPAVAADRALAILRADPLCADACAIGTVGEGGPGFVTATTLIGGSRVLDRLSGEQLPRIY